MQIKILLVKLLDTKLNVLFKCVIRNVLFKCVIRTDTKMCCLTDERSNQLLVLKTQRDGWHSYSSDKKIANKDHNRSVLQEAVGIVFENRRAEMRELKGMAVDELDVAVDMLCELQEKQDSESQLLLSLAEKVEDR